MPWQKNGRAWHTKQRQDRQGQPIEWESAALEYVVDRIAELGGDRLEAADWNHPSRVEIKAPGSKVDWFFHALTGGRWLLDLSFRVPTRRFKRADVQAQLALKSLDEREDLPIYGHTSRVHLRQVNSAMDQVRVQVHDKAEIQTPGFEGFLREAIEAYCGYAAGVKKDPNKAEPWKTNGKQWHLQQQRMTRRRRPAWEGTTLVQLLGVMQKAVSGVEVDWNQKISIVLRLGRQSEWWCRIVTAHREYIELQIRSRGGQFTPVMIERLGEWRDIRRNEMNGDIILVRFKTIRQLDPTAFGAFLKACGEGFIRGGLGSRSGSGEAKSGGARRVGKAGAGRKGETSEPADDEVEA